MLANLRQHTQPISCISIHFALDQPPSFQLGRSLDCVVDSSIDTNRLYSLISADPHDFAQSGNHVERGRVRDSFEVGRSRGDGSLGARQASTAWERSRKKLFEKSPTWVLNGLVRTCSGSQRHRNAPNARKTSTWYHKTSEEVLERIGNTIAVHADRYSARIR